MPQDTETFWEGYRALAARLLRPLGNSGGTPERDVAAAERRLGFRLPRLLREFYRAAGRRDDINGVFNRLVPPEELSVEDGALVFYEENQCVCHWGIGVGDLGDDDPPVLRWDSGPAWEPAFDHLSEFLLAMLFLQAVNGGMRHSGVGSASPDRVAGVGDDWETVRIGGAWNNRVLLRDGQVLYIMNSEADPQVFGGARTKRAFLALERAFGVSWDYCTLDDE